MIDCPICHRRVDGLFCLHCRPPRTPRTPRTPPPMGFDGLRAKLRTPVKRDPEADAERAAIQSEAA
jgi:hypothetical protein